MKTETNRLTYHFLTAGTICLVFTIFLSWQIVIDILDSGNDNSLTYFRLAAYFCFGFFQLAVVFVAVSCFFLAIVPISRHHSMVTAFLHFCLLLPIHIASRYASRFIADAVKQPQKYQEALLKRFLEANAKTEYGRRWRFGKITDRQDYRAKIPITTYEHYRSYVDRIAMGEQNLLTKDVIERLNVSSGTTGKCKLLPAPASASSQLFVKFFLACLGMFAKFQSEPLEAPLKSATMILTPKWRFSEGGNLLIGPASGVSKKKSLIVFTIGHSSPSELMDVYMSEPSQLYLRWLFALYDRDLVRIDGTFAGALLYAFDFLRDNWRQLVYDVRWGCITTQQHTADIPQDLVENFIARRLVWPDTHRADELEEQFTVGFNAIVNRIWPRINTISVCITGAHAVHGPRLRRYCGPDIVLFSAFFGASEGIFGMNMNCDRNEVDDEPVYTLLPHLTFMEFIQEDDIKQQQPETLFLEQLQVGKRYELVITSACGFYRYRMGDLVQVVRHRHNATPVVRFCSRVGSILDLRGEKTSEDMVYTALTRWCKSFQLCNSLMDFTTSQSVTMSSLLASEDEARGFYYVLFVELDGVFRSLTEKELSHFDKELCEISYPYKSFRVKGSIDMTKIFLVARGTFQKLKELALKKNGAVSNQYKTPRYFTNEEYLRLLLSSSFQHPGIMSA